MKLKGYKEKGEMRLCNVQLCTNHYIFYAYKTNTLGSCVRMAIASLQIEQSYIPSHIIKKYTSEFHTGGSLAKLLTCTVFLFAARKDNTYKWVGRLISISICNGGEAGNSLAPCLNLIAIGEHACSRTVNDVPSIDVRNTLE